MQYVSSSIHHHLYMFWQILNVSQDLPIFAIILEHRTVQKTTNSVKLSAAYDTL